MHQKENSINSQCITSWDTSKFLPQGSVRIEHKCTNKDLSVVALERPDGGIVIVILNN